MNLRKKILSARLWLSKPRILAGIMSGTSLDGIDVAIATFHQESENTMLKLHAFHTVPFSREEFLFFRDMIQQPTNVAQISDAQVYVSQMYFQALRRTCERSDIPMQDIDAIGIHGQTVWHAPTPHQVLDKSFGSTFQIASIPTLSVLSNTPVVGDFRSADVALGGQGAPLVPIFDYEFLRSKTVETIALNIGGMANVTLLPTASSTNAVTAFDTGSGNVWIDGAMMKFYGKRFDEHGSTASAGVIVPPLLSELQKIEFVHAPPPKSTGRELFSSEQLHQFIYRYDTNFIPPEDVIATITFYTAWSIAENIRRFGDTTARIIVSGGGIHNRFLLKCLREELPESEIISSEAIGVNPDAKEAMCFGFLAYRTLGQLPSNLPSVTGASRPAVLGAVAYP